LSTPACRRFHTFRAGLLAGGLSLALAVASARAEEEAESEALSPGEIIDLIPVALSKAGIRLFAEETVNLLADFGPADVTELRTGLGLRAAAPLSDSFALRVSAAGHASFFAFDGDRSELADELAGGELFTEGRAKLAWEDGASFSNAVKGSGTFGVAFELEPTFEVALGVDVSSRIDEGGVRVLPAFAFRWRIRDGMRLQSQGLGLVYAVDLHEKLELQLHGSWESDRYRLDGRSPALGAPTLRQREVPLLVALRWSPTRHWRLTAGAGSVVYQQWRIEAEEGGDEASVDAGPAALGWLRVEYRF
jgi:hypothetical protein